MDTTGKVVKKVCLQEYEVSYSEAAAECAALGFTLFKMDSPLSIETMCRQSEKLYGFANRGKVWVDRLNAPSCGMVDNTAGRFTPANDSCSRIHYSACEKLEP